MVLQVADHLSGVASGRAPLIYRTQSRQNLGRATAEIAISGIVEIRQRLSDRRPALLIVPGGHVGPPPRRIDAHAHRAVERASYAVLPHASVFGEEVSKTASFDEEELSIVTDALDGTYQALVMAAAYSSVAMGYQMVDSNLVPLTVAIATGSNFLSIVDVDGTVAFDDLYLIQLFPGSCFEPWQPRLMSPEVRGVAHGGAKPSHFADHQVVEEVARELDSRIDFVANLGGTPTIDGLLGGQLAASVATRHQAPWDAAQLFVGVHAGAVAFLVDKVATEVTAHNVKDLFTNPILDNSATEAEKRTIPPFVLGWDRDFVRPFALNLHKRLNLGAA